MSFPTPTCATCSAHLPASGICAACELERALTPLPVTCDLRVEEELDVRGRALPCDFGEYRLTREIARGGMGVVYEAEQIRARRTVALKMVSSQAVSETGARQRFRIEAEAAAKLDHPHIVTIHDVGEHDGIPFYSMRLVNGTDLAHRLAKGPLPVGEAVALLIPVARAVQHAHAHGILHRDLKPGNILLDADGAPHLTDFGLAKVLRGGQDQPVTREIIGTPAYMAPEMTRAGGTVTTAADVWALGAILYQCVSGRLPFPGESWVQIFKGIANDDPADPCPSDRNLSTVILSCLRKEPGGRYRSAAAFADDLERWRDRRPVLARRPTVGERLRLFTRRHPAIAALSALLLVSVVSGAGLFAREYQHKERARRQADASARLAREAGQRAQASERAALENLYFARIASAIRARETGDLGLARSLLASLDPSQRGLEWRLLDEMCRGDDEPAPGADTGPFARFPGEEPPGAVAFTPDGSFIVVGQGPDRVHVLDAVSGRLERTLEFPELPPPDIREPVRVARHLRFSPDGARFSIAAGNWIRVVDFASGRPVARMAGSQPQAEWLDDRRLLWGLGTWYRQRDEVLSWIFDVQAGRETPVPGKLSAPIAVSGDRRRVALCRDGGAMQVFETGNYTNALATVQSENLSPRLASLNGNGSAIAVYSGGGALSGYHVTVYDVPGGAKVHELCQPVHANALAMDPIEPRLHVASNESTLRSHFYRTPWPKGPVTYDDLADWQFAQPAQYGGAFDPPAHFLTRTAMEGLMVFRLGHEHNLLDVAYDPAAPRVATVSADGTLRMWRRRIPAVTHWRLADAHITSFRQNVCVNADASMFLVSMGDRRVAFWDPSQDRKRTFQERSEPLALLPGGRALVLRLSDLTCLRFGPDGNTANPGLRLEAEFKGLTPVGGFEQPCATRLAPDGRTVVGAFSGILFRIDADAGTAQCTEDLVMRMGRSNVQSFDLSPDGRWVVATGFGQRAQVRAVADLGTLVAELEGGTEFDTAVAFSPDGSMVVAGNEDGQLRAWRTGTWQPIPSAEPRVVHRGAVTAVAFAPDGTLLTSGGDDIRLWDFEPLRLRAVFPTGGPRHLLRFSPDGRLLIHGGQGMPLEVWKMGKPGP